MAPSRQSRSINRRKPFQYEVPLKKVEGEATKNWQGKRKLSDMLGPEWSKEELERFYEAYRKYGKDWKKVAAIIRHRSTEMVETLFNMNRAYLSLPEGTASIVGLVAMMTDHYAMMRRSDGEQNSSDGAGASRKSQKRTRAKLAQNNSKSLQDLPKLNSDAHDYGCLSLLKKRRSGSKSRAVGRRTPRIPVSYSYDRDFGAKFFLPNKQGLKQKMNASDDYDVAHEVAVVLTKASQKGGSSNLSRTPKRRTIQTEPSPVRHGKRTLAGSESTSIKHHDSDLEEGGCELSLGSSEGTCIGVLKLGKRRSIKTLEVKETARYDDIKEACSGTEEGEEVNVFKRRLQSRVSSIKSARSPSKGLRKKGKKVMIEEDSTSGFADSNSAFHALQTLADLSLMMPSSTADSTMQIMEEKEKEKEKVDTVKQSKVKDLSVPTEADHPGTSEARKAENCEISAGDQLKEKVHSDAGTKKRKQRSSPFRIPKADASLDSNRTDLKKTEVSKRKSPAKRGRMQKPPECTSSSTDLKTEINELQSTSLMNFTKGKGRSIHGVKKKSESDDKFLGSIKQDEQKTIPWFHDAALNPKEKLHHFLSRPQARRWCIFEWFYSAIDYSWFARREFAEYLDHVGLGHVPCLTRVEWGVIRSSLGKPRRFSKQFLKEEREKLLQHRESVRMHQNSLRSGTSDVLPSDLPRPLSAGQRVVVIHPKSREIHGGYVLTVDHSNCLIQFEQLELGIHWLKDIDCMPLNLLDNIPEVIASSIQASKKLCEDNGSCLVGQMKDPKTVQFLELPTAKERDKTDVPSHSLSSATHILKTSHQPEAASFDCNSQSTVGLSFSESATLPRARNSHVSDGEQVQAREADFQALSELTRALDKKEAVLLELRQMNDEVSKIEKDGVNSLKDSEPFKKQYAATLLRLNDLNQQVSSALCCLRRRNSYQETIHPKRATTLVYPTIHLSSIELSTCRPADCGPRVTQIIETSRIKARSMVAAAIEAASSLFKEAKNLDGFEEALDFINDKLSSQDFLLSADSVLVNPQSQDQVPLSSSTSPGTTNGLDLKPTDSRGENTEKIPSELIANCVATLLMIQNCTKRQCPPAEVAQIIDSAMKSLRPLCPQNLPIYSEIQNCMGMIRNQILGLVPTT